jgi:hypothetical protein
MTSSDKRFLLMLGGITVLGAGGLIYWGLRGGGAFQQAATRHEEATADVRRLEGLKPYPKADNKNAKEKALNDYRQSLATVQDKLAAFRPAELKNISSAEFGSQMLEVVNKVKAALAAARTKIPNNFAPGVETYIKNPARQNSTGLLSFQLGAIGEIFELLAQARPAEILNFHRQPLPEESGGNYQAAPGEIARALPVEITFRGTERCLREFINSLVNSQSHYFVIRSLRIKNQRTTGPTAEEAKFDKPKPAVVDPFSGTGFVLPGEAAAPAPTSPTAAPPIPPTDGTPAAAEAAPAAPTAPPAAPTVPATAPPGAAGEGERILKQLVGNEELEAFLRIDVLLFRSDLKLPQP